jgi:PAS domain S-box-containing protein
MFSSVFEMNPAATSISTLDGSRILKVNEAFLEVTGYSREEVVGTSIQIMDLYAEPAQRSAIIATLSESGQVRNMDVTLRRKDGGKRYGLISVVKTDYGQESCLLSVMIDITKRKAAERALERSREKLDLAINGSGLGMWDWMVQTGELEVNERWAEMLGYSLDELAPISIKTWEGLSHPADLKRSAQLLQKYFDGELERYECEVRMMHKDGHWVWVLDRGRVSARDDQGRPIRMSGTHLDISQRKDSESRLQEIEGRFEQVLSRNHIFVWEIDSSGLYTYVSQSILGVLGYTPEEVAGKLHFYDLHPEAGRREFMEAAISTMKKGGSFADLSNPILAKDGQTIWVKTNGLPLFDEAGILIGYRGSDTDVTEQKRLEEELAKATRGISPPSRK